MEGRQRHFAGARELESQAGVLRSAVPVSPDPRDARFAILWEYDSKTGLLGLDLACPKHFDEDSPWRNAESHFYINFPHVATTIKAEQPEERSEDIELELRAKAGTND